MRGGGRRRSGSLHFASRPPRRAPWRALAGAVALVVIAAAVLVILAAVEQPPGLRTERVLASSVTLPGAGPAPAWPSQGEAAAEVEGVGPLGSSGSSAPVPIASVAKVMTAWVVLSDHPLAGSGSGFTVTVTPQDATDYHQRLAQAQSVVAVQAGEQLNERQLLEGLLVASGNNLAVILADEDAGSVPAFVAKMNAAARQLGMSHSTYTDPSGLESSTVSTAGDQLILASKAMAVPAFASIVAMPSVNFPDAGTLPNFDRLVGTGGYVGIKTGSDSAAGGCLLFANRLAVAGRTVTVIGAILGQDQGHSSTQALLGAVDTAAGNLLRSVAPALAVRTAIPAGTTVAVVTNADGHRVEARTATALTMFGLGGTPATVNVTLNPIGRSLRHGQAVATVALAGGGSGTAAVASSTMPGVPFTWRLRHVL